MLPVTVLLRKTGLRMTTLALGCALLMLALPSARAEQLEDWRDAAVPHFSIPALDGVTVDLADQRDNLVIVHFFATWCAPCRDELTSLERLSAAFAARPLRIVAIDVGDPGDRVRHFLEREKIAVRYPVLIDFDKQVMREWGVEMLPTSYVLDAALCPHWKIAGALDWDVGQTLSKLEMRVSEMERTGLSSKQENCIAKGGTP
ncbi:MAG: TlpA disulfide reductase family protein [Hyphomicrobiaceae bacterium]